MGDIISSNLFIGRDYQKINLTGYIRWRGCAWHNSQQTCADWITTVVGNFVWVLIVYYGIIRRVLESALLSFVLTVATWYHPIWAKLWQRFVPLISTV